MTQTFFQVKFKVQIRDTFGASSFILSFFSKVTDSNGVPAVGGF